MHFGKTNSGAVVAMVQKVGFQSFRHVLRMSGREVSLEEAQAAPVRVQFIREPMARLRSAYCFYKTIYARRSMPQPGSPQPADVETWEAFMEYVRANPDNVHWRPQTVVVEAFIPNRLHKFEDIGTTWGQYDSRPFPHLNDSEDYPTGDVPDDISMRYEPERAIWRGL
tara:strand:+ start:1625 stop:2128 length:504 start_codon:yes stop_codon:yes gene_type:complete